MKKRIVKVKTKRKVTRKTPSTLRSKGVSAYPAKLLLNAAYGKFAVAPISSVSLKAVMTRAQKVLKQTARIQAEITKLAQI